MSRPIRIIGLLVCLTLVAAACGGDDDDSSSVSDDTDTGTTSEAPDDPPSSSSSSTTSEAPVTEPTDPPMASVMLVDHPYWDTPIVAPDQALLDELATDYVATTDDPQMERFLFGTVAVEVFDRIFAGVEDDEIASLLWLMHLSGYFGGRWLRGEIAEAQPEAPVIGVNTPLTEGGWEDTLAKTQLRLDALELPDADAVGRARESLFDTPAPVEGEDPLRGLAGNFGYNRGYMLEILATPPEGVEASPQFEVTCDGLFDCSYASPKLEALGVFADVQAAINADPPAVAADLVAELRPIQDAAEPDGTFVWSTGLSVQGFSQESYDQLLDTSSSFLETVQATALAVVAAVDGDDGDLARRAATADAAMVVWLDAYFAGLLDGEGEIVLPAFS